MENLHEVLELEERKQFDKALSSYNYIYEQHKRDYEIWRHFYFFLWTAKEYAPKTFVEKFNLPNLLHTTFAEGKINFSDKADFNFIVGYTFSIYPYEYCGYLNLEDEGKQMLLKATELEPDNVIYKMVYLGSFEDPDQEYKKAKVEAAPKVLDMYAGKGCLNNYFRQVLYRIDK